MSTCVKIVICLSPIAFVALFHEGFATVATQDRATKSVQETTVPDAVPEREKPFWENAQLFVDAYSRRDAEAIGKLFTEQAEFYDEFGERTVGRDAIVGLFQEVFDETPEALVEEISIDRVRFVTENVALEEGVVATTDYPGGPKDTSRYIALHVKEKDGVWRIHTLKDYTREKASHSEQLSELTWLIGEWMSEDPSSVVHTKCDWSDDGNYLLREFTVRIEGQAVMNGVQRIGWDPLRKQIRSWMFDSDGGFLEGVWIRNDDQWIVTVSGVSSQGEAASGTSVYTIHDAERITWRYRNLIVGNDVREDIDPVVMTRRPPTPGAE